MWSRALAGLALALAALGAAAQEIDWRGPALSAAAARLEAEYLSAAKGAELASALRQVNPAYGAIADKAAFARKVTADLYGLSSDKHLRLIYEPQGPVAIDPVMARCQAAAVESRRLEGNVAYVRIPRFAGDRAYYGGLDAAMAALTDARAMVLDLRGNCGGTAGGVRHVSSYFFAGKTLLAFVETRTAGIEGRWTFDQAPGPLFLGKPVYILVDAQTVSAGESFTFGMGRVTRRAKVVGQRTAGGGHFGVIRRLTPDFTIFVPIGRTYDPATGQGWEVDGLVPDIAAPPEAALEAALKDLAAR